MREIRLAEEAELSKSSSSFYEEDLDSIEDFDLDDEAYFDSEWSEADNLLHPESDSEDDQRDFYR